MAVALAGGGCHVERCRAPAAVEGTRAEYSIAAGDYVGYRVGAPFVCATVNLTLIPVTGVGTQPFAAQGGAVGCSDASVAPDGAAIACGPSEQVFVSGVAMQLSGAGAVHPAFDIGYCPEHDPASVPYLHVVHWQDAGPAVEMVGGGMRDQSIAGTTHVGVAPESVFCPD